MRTAPPVLAIATLVGLVACDAGEPALPGESKASVGGSSPITQLGDPLPGLTQAQLDAFDRGKVVFERRFKPSEGLGPLYNATSCSSCHSTPEVGGTADLYRNFYIAAWEFGGIEFSTGLPGMPSVVVPSFGKAPFETSAFTLEDGRPIIPDSIAGFPVTQAQRNSIPLFGVGLFETISDATILANADPEDLDGDGVSGRVNNDIIGLGRFGQKAQANNIEVFTRAPLMSQMGVTSDPLLGSGGAISAGHAFLFQASFDPDDSTTDSDGVPDPELSASDLADLIAFSRFLAPPAPQPFGPEEQQGEVLFDQVGCTACHLPSLAGSGGPVEAYTDLLIHDMGPGLADNINFGSPQPSLSSPPHTGFEFRTQPLWGVSKTPPYLHDGRAASLDEAIRLHGGEGAGARDAYLALTQKGRDRIVRFLEAL